MDYNIQMIDMYNDTNYSTKIGPFKTITWKKTSNGHVQDDIIFFKTLDDAFKMATQFKFLNNAQLFICICTDLIWPLNISYTTSGNTTIVTYSGPKHFILNHSDNCTVQIYGIEVKKVDIETDSESREISSYKVAI